MKTKLLQVVTLIILLASAAAMVSVVTQDAQTAQVDKPALPFETAYPAPPGNGYPPPPADGYPPPPWVAPTRTSTPWPTAEITPTWPPQPTAEPPEV